MKRMITIVLLAAAAAFCSIGNSADAQERRISEVPGRAGVILNIIGTRGGDDIHVFERTFRPHFNTGTGQYHSGGRHLIAEFRDRDGKVIVRHEVLKSQVRSIYINGYDEMDWIEVDTDIDCTIHTGGGFNFVVGGSGNDYISALKSSGGWVNGGAGRDTLVTRYSPQIWGTSSWLTLEGGADQDTFIYNPNDTLMLDSGTFAGSQVTPNFEYHSGFYAGFLHYTELTSIAP